MRAIESESQRLGVHERNAKQKGTDLVAKIAARCRVTAIVAGFVAKINGPLYDDYVQSTCSRGRPTQEDG